MNKPRGAVLFDLDGTLIDSAPDTVTAASAVLRDLSLPEIQKEEASEYSSYSMKKYIKHALARRFENDPPADLLVRAQELGRKYYMRECETGHRIYAGVPETLETLQQRGWRLACITNKPEQFTAVVLEACNLVKFFEEVVSGDTLSAKKPDPKPIVHACKTLNTPVDNAWMVGDSGDDFKAAEAANCRFIAVSYGYGKPPPAKHTADRFPDILGIL